MGCDGGTIPTRDELVKVKKRVVRLDPKLALDAKWKHCQLSNQPLVAPLVACEYGRLYNKEALLTFLLKRDEMPEEQLAAMKHVRSLKDVTELGLTPSASDALSATGARWACPVTSVEMNGIYRFVFMRPCGCVLSERAIKEVPSPTCHRCSRAVEETVTLNGTLEEIVELRARHKARLAAVKAEKKAKKAEIGPSAAAAVTSVPSDRLKRTTEDKDGAPAAKIVCREETRMRINAALPLGNPDEEWAFTGKTMQENPNASSNLKSLFTSSVPQKKIEGSFTSRTTYSGYW